jgi:hypothetical protein
MLYLKMGIKLDKRMLGLGYGKYSTSWLSRNLHLSLPYGYWVSKDISGYDTIDIYKNKEVYHKFTLPDSIEMKIRDIYYNILCVMRYGKTVGQIKNTHWSIK